MEQTMETGDFTDAAGPVETHETQPQAHQTQDEMVPVSALQAERRERQALQEKMRMLEDHVQLMQANQTRPKQDEYDGLADDDVLTVGEAKKFMKNMQQNYQMGIEELRISQKYPDYQKVVKDYLPKVIEKNPALKTTLQNDPNRYELAYYLAKRSDEYLAAHEQTKQSADAKRILDNAQQSPSLASVGHASAASSASQGYKRMSDDDFMKLVNKHRGSW